MKSPALTLFRCLFFPVLFCKSCLLSALCSGFLPLSRQLDSFYLCLIHPSLCVYSRCLPLLERQLTSLLLLTFPLCLPISVPFSPDLYSQFWFQVVIVFIFLCTLCSTFAQTRHHQPLINSSPFVHLNLPAFVSCKTFWGLYRHFSHF